MVHLVCLLELFGEADDMEQAQRSALAAIAECKTPGGVDVEGSGRWVGLGHPGEKPARLHMRSLELRIP
jgi:hypothetical protein